MEKEYTAFQLRQHLDCVLALVVYVSSTWRLKQENLEIRVSFCYIEIGGQLTLKEILFQQNQTKEKKAKQNKNTTPQI